MSENRQEEPGDRTPQFEKGDRVILERTASVPTATVQEVYREEGTWMYELAWSNGNTNTKEAAEIDRMAVNTDA